MGHLQEEGFKVESVAANNQELQIIKDRMGVPQRLRSCHTGVVGNYVVEGHVPAEIILRLLSEKPAVAGIAVAVLMLGFGLWGLVPIGIAVAHFVGFSAAMERKRLDRTLLGELLGTIGLTLVVPAAAYVCTGTLDLRTWALFILATAFFFSAVFHVRYLTRSRSERFQGRGARLRAAVPSLAVHAAAFVATAVLSGTGLLPPLAPVVVLPVVAKAVYAAVVQPSGFPPRPSWTRMAGATPRPGTLSGPASSPSASVLAWWDPSWPSSQRDICGAGVY